MTSSQQYGSTRGSRRTASQRRSSARSTTCAARYAARTLGPFDVVIADADLADGDGLELAAELKRTHGCRTLIVSTHDSPAPDAGGPNLPDGIDLWIANPVRLSALRKALRALRKP